MEISAEMVTTWKRALNAARFTVHKDALDKEPTEKWVHGMLLAEHSPIRLVEYDITIKDVPNFVVGHLVRHHQGCEKFVATHRSDRTGVDDVQITRLTPSSFILSANAQALMNISRKRLCGNASKETIYVWKAVKKAIRDIDPIMASKMVPECIYRGFCPELHSCRYCMSKAYEKELNEYRLCL